MQRVNSLLRATTLLALTFSCACAFGLFRVESAAAQTPDDHVVYLNQGWSQADRELYYQTTQGSAVLDYNVFLNLEVAGGQDLFRSDANSERYGLTPQAPNPRTNPDGLPVGLAKTVVAEGPFTGQEMVGPTCALCHNTQLYYKGKTVRIDGGVGNHLDFMAYIYALDAALQETLNDPAKFDRLAARVGATSADTKSDLRKRIEPQAQDVHFYSTRVVVAPYPWGPSRMDAISLIVNRLTSVLPQIPENWSTPIAPTKPPFLWNAPQGSWTQWRAVQQDPIKRNLTETMGVYMPIDLVSKTPEEGLFSSNAMLLNLETIEGMLSRLAPPKWPEEVFGKIDHAKANEGAVVFAQYCATCHNSYPYTWTQANKYGKRFIEVGMVPESYVGTDPGQFRDLRPYALTRQLGAQLPSPATGAPLIPAGDLYYVLMDRILGSALDKLHLTEEQSVRIHGYRQLPLPPPSRVDIYKAAPREGVWATPPFMHNGSVPNLYEMLIPASERTKKFYVGREFDPIKVGVDTSGKSGPYLVDTALPGSSNQGHSFQNGPRGNGIIGPLLTERQRWALVEYLKSIPEADAQITPFGGPANPRPGHSAWATAPVH
jgi:cytochrome c5